VSILHFTMIVFKYRKRTWPMTAYLLHTLLRNEPHAENAQSLHGCPMNNNSTRCHQRLHSLFTVATFAKHLNRSNCGSLAPDAVRCGARSTTTHRIRSERAFSLLIFLSVSVHSKNLPARRYARALQLLWPCQCVCVPFSHRSVFC